MKYKLEIELVPATVWFSSLYRILPKKVWNQIRAELIEKHGRKCHICGETEGRMSMHEIWEYDDNNHIQKLVGFQLLCNLCHHVKHIGLAEILASQGKLDYNEVVNHFCKVNNCSLENFKIHDKKVTKLWEERSKHQWKQDFGSYGTYIKASKKSKK